MGNCALIGDYLLPSTCSSEAISNLTSLSVVAEGSKGLSTFSSSVLGGETKGFWTRCRLREGGFSIIVYTYQLS